MEGCWLVGLLAGWLAGFEDGCLTWGTECSAVRPFLPCCLLRVASIGNCVLAYVMCTGCALSTFQGQEFPSVL